MRTTGKPGALDKWLVCCLGTASVLAGCSGQGISLTHPPTGRATGVQPITQDTTWRGLILVDDDVVVKAGAQLTVARATTVRVAPGKQILVRGSIRAGDNDEAGIVFTSAAADPAAGDWSGIRIEPADQTQPASSLRGCTVEYGQNGVLIEGNAVGPHAVTACRIRHNRLCGIFARHCKDILIEANRLEENGLLGNHKGRRQRESAGIKTVRCSGGSLRENILRKSKENGILLHRSAGLVVHGNDIEDTSGYLETAPPGKEDIWGFGVRVSNSHHCIVTENRVVNTGYVAIHVAYGSAWNMVARNTAMGAPNGIALTGCDNTSFSYNIVKKAEWNALYLVRGTGNCFYGNSVSESGRAVAARGGENTVENCRFRKTAGLLSTGNSKLTVRKCVFEEYVERSYGVYLEQEGTMTTIDCAFEPERARLQGDPKATWTCRQTLRFLVRDQVSGSPIAAASIAASTGKTSAGKTTTDTDGRGAIVVTAFVARKGQPGKMATYSCAVSAAGYRSTIVTVVPDAPDKAVHVALVPAT